MLRRRLSAFEVGILQNRDASLTGEAKHALNTTRPKKKTSHGSCEFLSRSSASHLLCSSDSLGFRRSALMYDVFFLWVALHSRDLQRLQDVNRDTLD